MSHVAQPGGYNSHSSCLHNLFKRQSYLPHITSWRSPTKFTNQVCLLQQRAFRPRQQRDSIPPPRQHVARHQTRSDEPQADAQHPKPHTRLTAAMTKQPDVPIPVDGSWRMVDGDENDSFDTSIVRSDDQDPFHPHLSPPSQLSSAGLSVGGSQDSIGDFVSRADDERNILRSSFQPSLPSARQTPRRERAVMDTEQGGARTPDPEFIMPAVEVEGRGGYNLRRRAPRPGDGQGSPLKKRVRARHYEDDAREQNETVGERVAASVPNAALGALSYLFGIVAMAFRYAQRPLAILLAIYLSCGALIMVQNMATQSIVASLSPVCRIPGASYLDLAFCPRPAIPTGPGEDGATGHVEFDDLMAVQGKFEKVLEKSADTVSLPMEMKRAESSIRDLRTMVRYSELPAREELAQEFDGYIDAARRSTAELQRFNARVGSAVDSIISVNRWTARYLDSLDGGEDSSADDGGLLWAWAGWIFSPFSPAVPDGVFDEGALRDRYIEHTALLSERVASLVLEANAILRHLSRAEGHLALIYEVSTRAGNSVRSRRDRVLHTLW
ncbi:hypothetical protein IMZ48_22225, partial [Candidatus Bathyarchaeota archaeon]|nr:hypothetical protein [Candidatus Bathyarchaeota archaeon]